jgi:hypothetical protein
MRPTAPQVVERLVGPLIGATTTTSTTDWDEKCTSKFRRSLQAQALLPSATQIERMLFGDGWSNLQALSSFDFLATDVVEGIIIQSAKESLLRSNAACTESLLGQESSGSTNNKGGKHYTLDIGCLSLARPVGTGTTAAQASV